MKNIMIKIFGIGYLLTGFNAYALTCVNDYGGTESCASNSKTIGNCETLGYSTEDVHNCGQYIYCPYDKNYKKCVREDDDDCYGYSRDDKTAWCKDGYVVECPSDSSLTACGKVREDFCGNAAGYNPDYKSINDCPGGSKDWEDFRLIKLPWGTCGKCISSCPEGYSPAYQDVSDCGASDEWVYSYVKSELGKRCGKCERKTCPTGYSTAYQTLEDCGNGAWSRLENNGTVGNVKCNKCIAKTCSNYVFTAPDGLEHAMRSEKPGLDYMCSASVSVPSGRTTTRCYKCYTCNTLCREAIHKGEIPLKGGKPFEGCEFGAYGITYLKMPSYKATYDEYSGECSRTDCYNMLDEEIKFLLNNGAARMTECQYY